MLLRDSRRDARLDQAGDMLVEEAFRAGPGPFAVQAAIAARHCRAARAEETDWPGFSGSTTS